METFEFYYNGFCIAEAEYESKDDALMGANIVEMRFGLPELSVEVR